MTLARSSKLVRWAYLFEYKPERTSLCAFFWRCVLLTPLKFLVPTFIVAALSVAAWNDPWGLAQVVGGVLGIILGVAGIVSIPEVAKAAGRTTLGQGFKAVKSNICPILTIRHGE